jgi:hypothetical protein
MLKRHHRISVTVWCFAIFPLLTALSGCTSPLWWHDPERGFLYKGWFVNIADQATVMRECESFFTVMGCVKPATMTAFSVNNPYILWHECRHIDNLTEGASEAKERLGDLIYALLGLNDLLTVATIAFPAANDCGEGTMAEWKNDKFNVVQRNYGNWQILPTVEEWNLMHPDEAIPNRRFVASSEMGEPRH